MSEDEIEERADAAARRIVETYRLEGVNPAYVSSIIREEFGDTRCREIYVPSSSCLGEAASKNT